MTVDAIQEQVRKARRVQPSMSTPMPTFESEPPIDIAEDPPRTFKLLTVADLHAMPPMRWRIHSVLPAVGYAALYGPSGSGKSFLVIDMMTALAEAARWFGYLVKRASVLYIALEGQAGVPNRVKAWEHANDSAYPDGVRFLFDSFKLTDRADVLGLAAAIEAAGGADVIVIDTLNRAAPGADENSSQDMGRVLEAVKQLQAMTGGLVLLVHHTGKDAAKGMRGHSSVFAGLDAVIETSRAGDARSWTLAKAKDGQDGQNHPFRLRRVDFGEDDDGVPVTSCTVCADVIDDELTPNRPKLPKGGNQKIVYDALGPLFRESRAFGKAGAPATRPCLTQEQAIAGTRDRLVVDQKRRTERAQQAIAGLVATSVLGSNEGWLWLN